MRFFTFFFTVKIYNYDQTADESPILNEQYENLTNASGKNLDFILKRNLIEIAIRQKLDLNGFFARINQGNGRYKVGSRVFFNRYQNLQI